MRFRGLRITLPKGSYKQPSGSESEDGGASSSDSGSGKLLYLVLG